MTDFEWCHRLWTSKHRLGCIIFRFGKLINCCCFESSYGERFFEENWSVKIYFVKICLFFAKKFFLQDFCRLILQKIKTRRVSDLRVIKAKTQFLGNVFRYWSVAPAVCISSVWCGVCSFKLQGRVRYVWKNRVY